MRKIALIGCCKKKLGENNPNALFYAKDIYIGNSFKKSKTEGVKIFNCEDYYILSAEHCLLDKNKKITYYDKTLSKMKAKDKREWAKTVLDELNQKFDLRNDEFYIFAGKNYYENLVGHLNCVVFKYKNSNCITFDIKEKFRNGLKSL